MSAIKVATRHRSQVFPIYIIAVLALLLSIAYPPAAYANSGENLQARNLVSAQAATPTSGECGPNATYTQTREGTDIVVTISGTGTITSSPWSTSNYTKVIVEDGITAIGNSAFSSNNTYLKEAYIADSVEYIGDKAFSDARRLSTVKLPANLKQLGKEAFSWCLALESLDLPEGLEEIGERCFERSGLGTVRIPSSLSTLPQQSFANCTSLTDAVFTGETSIGDNAFEKSWLVTVSTEDGARISGIGKEAFSYCTKLKSVSIAGTETAVVGRYAFEYCRSLEQVTIKQGFESVDSSAFEDASALETVDLSSSSIKAIGGSAFSRCSSMRTALLPASLRVIGIQAFSGCTSLKELALPDAVREIRAEAFRSCTSNPFGEHLVIPASVTVLGGGSFEDIPGIRTFEFMGDDPGLYMKGNPFRTQADVIIQQGAKWSNRSFLNSVYNGGDLTWYKRNANGSLTKLPYICTYEETKLAEGKTSSASISRSGSHCYSITLSAPKTIDLTMFAVGDRGCVHWSYLFFVKDPKGSTVASGTLNYRDERLWKSNTVKLPSGTSYVEVTYLDSHHSSNGTLYVGFGQKKAAKSKATTKKKSSDSYVSPISRLKVKTKSLTIKRGKSKKISYSPKKSLNVMFWSYKNHRGLAKKYKEGKKFNLEKYIKVSKKGKVSVSKKAKKGKYRIQVEFYDKYDFADWKWVSVIVK